MDTDAEHGWRTAAVAAATAACVWGVVHFGGDSVTGPSERTRLTPTGDWEWRKTVDSGWTGRPLPWQEWYQSELVAWGNRRVWERCDRNVPLVLAALMLAFVRPAALAGALAGDAPSRTTVGLRTGAAIGAGGVLAAAVVFVWLWPGPSTGPGGFGPYTPAEQTRLGVHAWHDGPGYKQLKSAQTHIHLWAESQGVRFTWGLYSWATVAGCLAGAVGAAVREQAVMRRTPPAAPEARPTLHP